MYKKLNEVIKNILQHKTIRRFKKRKIESKKIDLIINAGIRAATAGNLQQYSLIVVDDKKLKMELQIACENQEVIGNASICIAAFIDIYRHNQWLKSNGAPIHCDSNGNMLVGNFLISYWDAIIALQNITIAAESLGLGTCYIGNFLEADISKIFQTPEYVFPA